MAINRNRIFSKITDDFWDYVEWSIALLMSTVFLSIWVAITWLVNTYVISQMHLAGLDKFVLWILQLFFNISTLVPVAAYIIRDIVVTVIKVKNKIKAETSNTIVNKEVALISEFPSDSQ